MTQNGFGGDVRRQAGWLPSSHDALEEWLAGHRQRVEAKGQDMELHPAVVNFQRLIATDPVVGMYVRRMIAQVPETRLYSKRHLEDPDQLLRLINEVLTMAPEFGDQNVTLPLGAILDWTMGTPAGFAAFRHPKVNAALKKILTAWCEFLSSPESLYVLNASPSGWTRDAARQAIGIDQYEHDPADRHWGFTSWNDFFTRRFRDGARPVAAPDDHNVIVAACESTPFSIRTGVKRRDEFWLKTQPYSLEDMLANDEAVEDFVGGTVYQAFLSATNYHRWHSPVAGIIVRAFLVEGTYYSEGDSLGSDAIEPTHSQAYLAHVAARAVFLLRADNPAIGLVGFVPVGMSEVSSCVIHPHIEPGHHVAKGEELGYFQFGGSTHCLVFGPGVIGGFAMTAIPQPHDPAAPLVLARSHLATVAPKASPAA